MQNPIDNNDPRRFAEVNESQYFDRKSARLDAKEVARHISAFANAAGGKLVIGIEDDGRVTGFRRQGARNVEDFEQAALLACEPVPNVQTDRVPAINAKGEDDYILVLDVKASTDHVIWRKSDHEAFLRQGDKSMRLLHEQILSLEYDKNQRRFEDEAAKRSSMADVDVELMARYKARIGAQVSDEQVLASRGMLVDGHLTNAGVLLFAEYPAKFMPWARVRVIKFDGKKMETGKRTNVVKERTFDGPLPRAIEGAKAMISEQLREFQYLGDDGRFGIVPEYPEFAWFEGLVNAVTHRNYALSGDHIRVMMYDDRMEIHSPGNLPNVVTLENMRYTRWSRNPTIARTLAEFGWVRETNEGVQRIYDEMAASLLHDPIYSEPNAASVLLTLENSITSRMLRREDSLVATVGREAYEKLSEYEIAALQYVYVRGKVTVKKLKEHLGRSDKVSRTTLKSLVDKGMLVWHGSNPSDPSLYYTLKR